MRIKGLQVAVPVVAMVLTGFAAPQAKADADFGMEVKLGLKGLIVTPGSRHHRTDGGGHTNLRGIVALGQPMGSATPAGTGETPASLACIYGLTTLANGCNPASVTAVAKGGSKAIAIVDAYDYPTAAADLAVFSQQYGLPAANFQVIYASGKKPAVESTGGWAVEAALDIQAAHALAPNAKIILVEAASSSIADLMVAEAAAVKAVAAAGGGQVSNSWAAGEFRSENNNQSNFTGTKVVAFASSGDVAGTEFPAVLANVIAVGGTTINRDASGNYTSQTSWGSSGGGRSAYIARPSFQSAVSSVAGTQRATPDMALAADPASGMWVYNTTPYNGAVLNWSVWGGTSLASPLAAALVNAAGGFASSASTELTKIYGNLGKAAAFTDIAGGACGNLQAGQSLTGFDLCTGVGAPTGTSGL